MSILEVYTFLSRGGWLMIPIGASSVLALAFFLERIWRLRRSRVLPEAFVSRLIELLEDGEYEKADELCRQTDSSLGPMVTSALEHRDAGRSALKERVEEVGQREVFRLERFVNALGAIATISPLLGLLGTVVGMIDVFQDVVAQSASTGQVQAAALATGIWQALITTASGLTIAIPVYLGYRYLLGRIDEYAVELEDVALDVVDELSRNGEAARSDDDAQADRSEEVSSESTQDPVESEKGEPAAVDDAVHGDDDGISTTEEVA